MEKLIPEPKTEPSDVSYGAMFFLDMINDALDTTDPDSLPLVNLDEIDNPPPTDHQ